MKMETLKQQILTAKGDVRAELVLKNARVINVFTNEIEQADVAIRQGVIPVSYTHLTLPTNSLV